MYVQVYQKQLESNYMVPPPPPNTKSDGVHNSWEGNKGGLNTSWFSSCVRRKPRRFLLPCNWLVEALIIQYVRNLQVGVFDGVSQS